MTEDAATTIRDIEDLLFPQLELNVWERAMYYNLYRQTHLSGTRSATIPLLKLCEATGMSEWKARGTIRALSAKGCIHLEQTRKGHRVELLLPTDLGLSRPKIIGETVDIETLDFYDRKYVNAFIERETGHCFYCLRKITAENAELDHVVPLVKGGDNSYRNIVAACHGCNKRKQGDDADAFLRSLLREGLLSDVEFADGLGALESLKAGQRVPSI